MTYHAKVIDGGKIVLPAALRREMGLNTGDIVVIERDKGGDHVLKSYRQVVREVQARVKARMTRRDSVDDFLGDRCEEALREEENWERLAREGREAGSLSA